MTAKMNRKAHATCRKSSDRRRILSSGAFRSKILFGSRLGQTEKSQNSPSGKVLKIKKNPAEIARFQPDLVGVSGFEPEASWSRRLVGYFSRTFRAISAPFQSENFTAASFPARIIPPDFRRLGHGLGQNRKSATQKLRRSNQRLSSKSSNSQFLLIVRQFHFTVLCLLP